MDLGRREKYVRNGLFVIISPARSTGSERDIVEYVIAVIMAE